MRLGALAPGIKCRNAGASWLSIDLPFDDEAGYRACLGGLRADVVARLYGLDPEDVQIFPFEAALAIKITLPRLYASGGIAETDFDGAQQFAPLLDLEIS
jgi:hypothetical protein